MTEHPGRGVRTASTDPNAWQWQEAERLISLERDGDPTDRDRPAPLDGSPIPRATVQTSAPMVRSHKAEADVRRVRTDAAKDPATRAIVSDSTARTLAAWWSSSGTIGRTLAALSTGRPVSLGDLLDDITATRIDARPRPTITPDDLASLDALTGWALARATVDADG